MDEIIKFLQSKGVPVTRANYVEVACAGTPEELDPEFEAELDDLFDSDGQLIQ